MAQTDENPTIFDYSIFGLDDNKNVKEEFEEKALLNSLKLWIASYRGDYIGGLTKGGYVTSALGRPMANTDVDEVYSQIHKGLTTDFTPRLVINKLKVEPNKEKRRWEITLDAYFPDLRTKIFYKEAIKEQI